MKKITCIVLAMLLNLSAAVVYAVDEDKQQEKTSKTHHDHERKHHHKRHHDKEKHEKADHQDADHEHNKYEKKEEAKY
jgi:Ni/Co efflux regulator RcnB